MKVIVKQKSEHNEPVEIVWCGSAEPADDVTVLMSVAQLLKQAKSDVPWAPQVLEIRVEL